MTKLCPTALPFCAVEAIFLPPRFTAHKVSSKHFFCSIGVLRPGVVGAPHRVRVQKSQAQTDFAKSQYKRLVSLAEKDFASKASLEEARANLHIAESTLEEAKINLSKTKIRAPFDGVVGLQHISVGAFVHRNQELLYLTSVDPVYVDFVVPESYARQLTLHQEVDVFSDRTQLLPLSGSVIAIDPKTDNATHGVQIRAQASNADQVVNPGSFVRVNVHLGANDQALLVPETAVQREGEQDYVFIVSNNQAFLKAVTIGFSDDGFVQILEGVKEGDIVVTVGQSKVYDGWPVRFAGPPKKE